MNNQTNNEQFFMKHILTITDKDITSSDKLSYTEPRIAVDAVLFDADGNIALSYMGKYDLHTLPGGGVEDGEDFRTAIKRELWEETGCNCEIIAELGEIYENCAENDFTQVRSYYIARVIGEKGSLHLTDAEIAENTTVVWHSPDMAFSIIADKQHDNYKRKFIQKRDIAALIEFLIWLVIHDIPSYDTFVKIEPIAKGWWGDKKYYIKTADGRHMLLRVSDITEYDRKKAEYGIMERAYGLGVLTPQPYEFGLCDGGKSCYSLSGWLDGEDAETQMPLMTETEQYVLGVKAGETLRNIHSIPAPNVAEEWSKRYFSVVDERINAYRSEGVPFEGSEVILSYLEKNRDLLKNRPQCSLHGDYHAGNLIIDSNNELYVIDCLDEFGTYGDPWYDFKMSGENGSTYFSTGLVRGYFNGFPPQEFWDLLTYYLVMSALTSIVWMKYNKPEELPEVLRRNEEIARFINDGRSPLMKWFLKDFYIQYTDGVPYKLKSPFDFSFLSKYGRVFKVFDDQDSGNICFGTADGKVKYFVKFAGAPTERACVGVEEAVANLKRTVPIYRDLTHPNLIKFISAEEIGGGFAMVFEWVDAECMHPMYPSSHKIFMQIPLETKEQVFLDILAFHAHAAGKGYVAIDFYDGSIMYDFKNSRTVICDIDFYTKIPYTNSMGRMWGNSRFMSPEEFELGAAINEVTNVYTMGATAFALFGDNPDRCFEKWKLSKELFDVAKRAVSDEREARQQSIKQLINEWKAVKT